MNEEKRARAGDTAKSPRKSPRMGPPAAAREPDSGGGGGAAPPLEVSNPLDLEKAAALVGSSSIQQCGHIVYEQDYIDMVVTGVWSCKETPMCNAYACATSGERNILVCLECESCFCRTHSYSHAFDTQHWVVFWYDNLNTAFCIACQEVFDISGKKNVDKLFISTHEKDKWGTMVCNEAGGHESGLTDDGHAHAIKGIPNLGNTCYLNSLVQCLLVLRKLRERMLGLDAPLGPISMALGELFLITGNVNNAGGLLDATLLLGFLGSLNERFVGIAMQDSHELLCFLRDRLDEEERTIESIRQSGAASAVAPTFIDSIFGGQLSITTSCKCCSYSSLSHDVFYDLSVPLPPKGSSTKNGELEPWTKGCSSQQKICTQLVPAIGKSNTEKIHTSEGSDFQSPALDLEKLFMLKTSEPLKVDLTKVEQISQSKDAAHGPLQIQNDEVQGQTIQVPIKAVDSLPQNMLSDDKVEGFDVTTADSNIPEDIGPPSPVPPLRKENAQISSGSDVEENDSVVLDASNEQEVSTETKMNTFSAEVTSEDKGKSQSSDIVGDEADDVNSLASIEECLELHFKAEMIEWTCENCSKVAQMSSTNEDTTVYGGQTEQSEKVTCQSEQSSNLNSLAVECSSSSWQPHGSDSQHQVMLTMDSNTKGVTPGTICADQDLSSDNIAGKKHECHEGVQEAVPTCRLAEKQDNMLSAQDQHASTLDEERGKQVKLHRGAHQVEENKNEQKDRNKGATQTCLISKLPSVLAIHLKRSLGPHKVTGHVSFKEILDLGLFMDPSSEDKDNSSYCLVGVVEHRGLGNDAGHYVAYVRPSPRRQNSVSSSWFLASDDSIKEIPLEEVLKCEAYLLFYERLEG